MNKAFAFFQRVIGLIRKQLERIAGSSQGDHSVEDLTNEAWLIVDELHVEPNANLDPEDESVRELIVTRLQREFGRFVNRQERFATRIDRDDIDDDGDFMPNAVAARLSAPEKYEPLVALEMREDAAAAARAIGGRFSEAHTSARLSGSMVMRCVWRPIWRSERERSIDEWRAHRALRKRSRRCSMASRRFQRISCHWLGDGPHRRCRISIDRRARQRGRCNCSSSSYRPSCSSAVVVERNSQVQFPLDASQPAGIACMCR
ncbi:hypothetical protein BTI_1085 [Burkholderia thailandensis MSMB121]|uniref:hypothetical protein n=1 Tax=Burkholderia humptydooensis TaxID=430531 RepID=UPI000327F6F6|nr:hypothetical protein [Burkholderia humptydooensis]AGK47967.1 hypothetical protein BTI_1085 [Burkholderia thailandensis MSMB121]